MAFTWLAGAAQELLRQGKMYPSTPDHPAKIRTFKKEGSSPTGAGILDVGDTSHVVVSNTFPNTGDEEAVASVVKALESGFRNRLDSIPSSLSGNGAEEGQEEDRSGNGP